MVVAGTGSGADSVIFPYILNGVLGTKMKIVTGYPGAADFLLAVERQEADGTAGVSWSGLNAARPEWIAKKQINVIVQLGLKKHPGHGPGAAGDGVRQERFRPRRAGADLLAAGHGLSDRGAARHAAGARGGPAQGVRSRAAAIPNISPTPRSSTSKPSSCAARKSKR